MAKFNTRAGREYIGERGRDNIGDLTLHLFSNDAAITDTVSAAAFTDPAFAEYAAKPLAENGWSALTIENGNPVTSHSQQEWSYSNAAAESIYGYYVTSAAGDVLWGNKFSTPQPVAPDSDSTIQITPAIEFPA